MMRLAFVEADLGAALHEPVGEADHQHGYRQAGQHGEEGAIEMGDRAGDDEEVRAILDSNELGGGLLRRRAGIKGAASVSLQRPPRQSGGRWKRHTDAPLFNLRALICAYRGVMRQIAPARELAPGL